MDQLERLNKLTSLRFIAAIYVIIFHNVDILNFFGENVVLFFHHGYVAVSLFFILSGYILTYTYLKYVNTFKFKTFIKKRFLKLYPAYILAFIISLPLSIYFYISSPESRSTILIDGYLFVSSLFMVQSWTPHLLSSIMNINGPGWTLSVEMFLYLLFPMLLVYFNKLSSNKLKVIFSIYILTTILLILHYLFKISFDNYTSINNDNNSESYHLLIQILPIMHIPQFLLGIISAIIICRMSIVNMKIIDSYLYFSVIVLFILLNINILPGYLMNNGILGIFFIAIIVKAHISKSKNLLDNKYLVMLGDASYHLYIFAWPVGRIFSIVFSKTSVVSNVQLQFLIYIITLSAFSLFTNSLETKIKSYYLNPIK